MYTLHYDLIGSCMPHFRIFLKLKADGLLPCVTFNFLTALYIYNHLCYHGFHFTPTKATSHLWPFDPILQSFGEKKKLSSRGIIVVLFPSSWLLSPSRSYCRYIGYGIPKIWVTFPAVYFTFKFYAIKIKKT